jgi:hypothetical protein
VSALERDPSSKEPYSYKAALQIPVWKEAMHNEMQALQAQKTWSLVPLHCLLIRIWLAANGCLRSRSTLMAVLLDIKPG